MTYPKYLTRPQLTSQTHLRDGGRSVDGNSPVGAMQRLIVISIVIRIFDHVQNATTLNVRTPVIVMAVVLAAAALDDQPLWWSNDFGLKPNCWRPGSIPGGSYALEFYNL